MLELGALYFLPFMLWLSSDLSFASEGVPVQARVFVGSATANPEDVNLELESEGLKTIKTVYQLGAEVAYPVARFFELGLRYTKRYIHRDEQPSSLLTTYRAEVNQDSVMLVGRVPIVKTKLLRLDGFAGVGGTNTTLKINTADQAGQVSRSDAGQWFGDSLSSFGGSLALGYKYLYFIVEGGIETNKVGSLRRTGTVNENIEEIDLSGSFVSIGLLFDGVNVTRK